MFWTPKIKITTCLKTRHLSVLRQKLEKYATQGCSPRPNLNHGTNTQAFTLYTLYAKRAYKGEL